MLEMVVLQIAFTRLIADWAIDGMPEQEIFFDVSSRLLYSRRGGDEHGGWCGLISFFLAGDIRPRFEESGQRISFHPKFVPAGHAAICAPINDISER
jgi:hypothetical protein